MECIFPPLLFLHTILYPVLRRTWWNGVKEDGEKKELGGNQLTQIHLEIGH